MSEEMSEEHEEHDELFHKDVNSLSHQITALSLTANLLDERLDSMQALLDQQLFPLDKKPVKINKNRAAVHSVYYLLKELHLTEENLCLGDFLRAFNR